MSKAYDNDVKPVLVLHIGPHKTATTTIQCELTYFRSELAQNKNAPLIYLGRTGVCNNESSESFEYILDSQALGKCLDNEVPCNVQKEWKDSIELLGKLANKKYNVIVSDEIFSRILPKKESLQLLHSTLSQLFQVKVVIGYRRYFEWRVSSYSEAYKNALDEEWPRDGGRKIVPFTTSYRYMRQGDQRRYREAAEQAGLHPTEYLQQLWTNYSFHVEIFNMHQDGDLITNFVSNQILPEGVKSALDIARMNANRMPQHKNPSASHVFDYDMLAVEALEKGLIPKHEMLSRQMVSNMIQQVLNEYPPNNITRMCLTESEQEELLEKSLSYERHLFPAQSDEFLANHKSEFEKAVRAFRFCNLDTDELMQNWHVLKLFKMLRGEYGT